MKENDLNLEVGGEKMENDISEVEKQSTGDVMAKRNKKGKLKGQIKNRVQVQNPVTKKWVKVDTKTGTIIQQKSDTKPYKSIKKYKKKR